MSSRDIDLTHGLKTIQAWICMNWLREVLRLIVDAIEEMKKTIPEL